MHAFLFPDRRLLGKLARMYSWPLSDIIKIVDFGKSLCIYIYIATNYPPKTLHTPLYMPLTGRAPERWLEDMYFDGERRQDLTGEDITKLEQQIIQKITTASAREILNDHWFMDWAFRYVNVIYLFAWSWYTS